MSLIDTYSNNIKRKKEEINRLKLDRLKYIKNLSNNSSKIIKLKQQASNTKSISILKSKQNEISREEKKKSEAEKKISEYDKKITIKEKELILEEKKLLKEQEKFDKKNKQKIDKSINDINNSIKVQELNQQILYQDIKTLKKAKEKINILFIGANPTLNLNLEKEAREIQEAITKSLKRDSINFQTRWATRTTDLFQYINEVNPTIIHFSGHGTDNGELIFQDNNDNIKLVSREAIVELINASSDEIRLIVFNNCYSSTIAESVVENIEAAIGMNISIGDEAAILFASQLYSSIGFGHSLEKAFKQAVTNLKINGIPESNTPQLFVNKNLNANNIYLVNSEKNNI